MTTSRTFLAALTLAAASAFAFSPTASAAPNAELKDLMKKLGAATSAEDTAAMAPLLAKTKAYGKSEYTKWAALSDKGEAAAKAGDLAGAKATCKGCHDEYKAPYKTKYGSKAP